MLSVTHRSIRFRLTVWYSLALAAGLGLFALAIFVSMRHSLLADVDKSLRERSGSIAAFANTELAEANTSLREELAEYSSAFPPGTYLEVKDNTGAVVFVTPSGFPWQTARSSALGLQRVKWKHHAYRLLTAEATIGGQGWQVLIAESLDEIETLLDRLRLLLVTFIPAVIFVAIMGGQWLSRRALAPVDQITAAARSLGIGNLSARLPIPQTGDELQRLAETWNSMLSRLENAITRLSRFTADASHELRTPLAVIRTTAEIAARKSRSAESYREALSQIVAESEQMTQLVDDLLFLARCDSEPIEMPMGALNLAAIVESLCEQVTPLARSKSMEITYRAPNDTPPVLGNEPAVRRLVLVLLDNAIKYSAPGGQVTVRVHHGATEVRLEIADSGPGIPDSELPKIFERFYRAPEARDSGEAGCGLGLSLAAGIAQKHHAQIQVSSAPEKGSIFRVSFQLTTV